MIPSTKAVKIKLIIAGSRTLNPTIEQISGWIEDRGLIPSEIVSGRAQGVDQAGEWWAIDQEGIKLTMFPADWDKHGRAAGPIRNREMAEYGDALLLIWDGTSKGSRNMKMEMERLHKPVYEIILK